MFGHERLVIIRVIIARFLRTHRTVGRLSGAVKSILRLRRFGAIRDVRFSACSFLFAFIRFLRGRVIRNPRTTRRLRGSTKFPCDFSVLEFQRCPKTSLCDFLHFCPIVSPTGDPPRQLAPILEVCLLFPILASLYSMFPNSVYYPVYAPGAQPT